MEIVIWTRNSLISGMVTLLITFLNFSETKYFVKLNYDEDSDSLSTFGWFLFSVYMISNSLEGFFLFGAFIYQVQEWWVIISIIQIEKNKKLEELYFSASNKSSLEVFEFNKREELMEKVFNYSIYIVLPLIYPGVFLTLKLFYIFGFIYGYSLMAINISFFLIFIVIFIYTFFKTYYGLKN